MTDLNHALCERLRTITACPVCGAPRKEFVAPDRMAIAVLSCGADIVAVGGSFITALGCKTPVIDALAKIKSEEASKLEASAPCPR